MHDSNARFRERDRAFCFLRLYAARRNASAAARRGAPIVFLHGASRSHLVWGEPVRALGQVPHAVALDLPGDGKSQSPGRNSVDGYRDVVLGLLDALQFDRAVIVDTGARWRGRPTLRHYHRVEENLIALYRHTVRV